ncbi:MAG: type II toxin-antitoxin system VapC family toxin [Acidobacteria bacterium]|nr:type II toxin-antitoxin system VapC family toxin [Acidobacteriota bacterium]
MSFSLDVNILLYASDTGSPYFDRARSFVESCIQRQEIFYLGWSTVMSYLRIATHPSVFDHPLTPREAMANIETLLSLPHARFLAEGDGFWEVYRAITAEVPTRGNLVADAHLAALLRHHGVKTLYTHDRDFLRFSFLDVRDPLLSA